MMPICHILLLACAAVAVDASVQGKTFVHLFEVLPTKPSRHPRRTLAHAHAYAHEQAYTHAHYPRPARTHARTHAQWSWSDVALECETFLGPKGFEAVQVRALPRGVGLPCGGAAVASPP